MDETINGIPFDWWGCQTSTIVRLCPQKGIHSAYDIDRAKAWLFNNYKIKKISVNWVSDDL